MANLYYSGGVSFTVTVSQLEECPLIIGFSTVMQELLNEASSQYSIQQQAQALLQICSEENAADQIEAERILLLAGKQ